MLHSIKTACYRFRQDLPPHTPLAVRSVGQYELHPNSHIEPPFAKWFCEIFWCVEGSGAFRLGDQMVPVNPGQVFYLLPGELHDIQPTCAGWKYHWFTLDHEIAPRLLEAFGFDARPFTAAQCPTAHFEEMTQAVQEGSLSGDRKAAQWAHAILTEAVEQSRQSDYESPSDWIKQCKQQIDDEFSNSNLNVTTVANRIGIHRTTLFRAFKQCYHMTPSAYLQNRRLHHALEQLKHTNDPIQEIALNVGMPDTNYLARLIKKATGLPPSRFRASHR